MWKFQDLYEAIQKKFEKGIQEETLIPKHFKDIEDEVAYQWHKRTPDVHTNPCGEYFHRTPDGRPERNYYPATESFSQVGGDYAMCKECGDDNWLYYDKRVFDECPRCKELRMEREIEFIEESEMIL